MVLVMPMVIMSEDDEDYDEQSVKRWKSRFGRQAASDFAKEPIFNPAKRRRGLPTTSTAPQTVGRPHGPRKRSKSINSKWLAGTRSESHCGSLQGGGQAGNHGNTRMHNDAQISVSESISYYYDIGDGDTVSSDGYDSPVVARTSPEKSGIERSPISVPQYTRYSACQLEYKRSHSDTDCGSLLSRYPQHRGKRKLSNGGSPGHVKRQTSLLPFLSGHSSIRSSSATTSDQCQPMRGIPQPHIGAGHSALCNGEQSTGRGWKTCPSYKNVPGTSFVVDAFQYGSIPGCSAYFLSHFHSDHYQGLRKSFKHPIYCSQVTANLVLHCLKVPVEYVHALSLNETSIVEGVEVTLLEANHCPGSVMFLFKLSSGQNHLHSGDFRFCEGMREYPQLADCSIQQLFLDTTYCSPQYDFPRQNDVIGFAVQKVLSAIKSNPRTLIVCGTYTIGKEKVFLAIAEAIGSKVCVSKDKKAILDCLESERVAKNVTTDPGLASVHVLPMGRLIIADLVEYLDRLKPGYTSLLAFKPTGWTYSSKHIGLSSIRPLCKGAVTVYGIPYSEHCSFTELREFVQFLRPKKVVSTVGSIRRHREMEGYFQKWLSGGSRTSAKTIQTTLDLAFTFNEGRQT